MAAALSHSDSDSKSKYSWWWDSHISPKNSKWLQENLTDMDVKVKQMIKLIEEDADSFARRAEMYYKKRPELMKLVEEFYRAYRALAERYDHATGVIRQAHRTMAEAFPNQVPPVPADDLPLVSSTETEPHTPVTPHHSHGLFDQHGAPNYEPDTAISKMGLKQLNDLFMLGEDASHVKHLEGRAKRGLTFLDSEETNGLKNGSHDNGSQGLSESERMTKAETEILALKKALAKLESEKEAGLLQYQQSLERLSNLESEVSNARENSQGLDERASKAEAEVQTLKEALVVLQAEREANLFQYQQCLEKISTLELSISSAHDDVRELNDRAIKAETETESLKHDLARIETEKEAAVARNNHSLDSLSKLEERLEEAEENARRLNEEANIARSEVEALKLDIAKLTEEKEDAALRYEQCLEIISSLKHKLSCAEKEVYKLKSKIADEAEKLKSSEQKCLHLETSNLSLQSELQSLTQKISSQSEEFSEKQKELSRLWTSIQEERLRFIDAETAFQTLQNLHSKSQDDLRSLAAVVHNMESQNQALEDEVHRVKEENKILDDVKLSSSLTIKNLENEILNLRATIKKLEQEVGLRVDERNALQQEIYCLKEELNGVNKRHESMMEDVRSTGLDTQDFASSAKKLQDENSKLKEACKVNQDEKASLLQRLEIMEQLLEKNSVMEISLSNLNAELEAVREKVKVLEETCQSLLAENSTLAAEKATLFSQLQTTAENLEKLSEKNKILESSLCDVNAELEGLRVKSKILEDSCQSLDHEKSSLSSEKEYLISQLTVAHQTLEDLEKQRTELELKHLDLKLERESALQKVEELLVSLYAEREENSRVVQLNEDNLAEKEFMIHILQEDANHWKGEYDKEVEGAVHAQMEIFILQKSIMDLEQKNFSLLVESQRLLEASKMSDRLISKVENDNVQKQVDENSMSEKIKILRIGLLQISKTLDINSENTCEDIIENQELLNHIHSKLEETQDCFFTACNESEKIAIENSVLVTFLRQLKSKAENLVTERDTLDEELRTQSKEFLALQTDVKNILEKNEDLKLTIRRGEQKMKVMATEIENLCKQLSELEEAHKNIQEESCKTSEEKSTLLRRFLDLAEEKSNLEEEICAMIHETVAQSNLSLIYQNIIFEKLLALKELSEDLERLCSVNTNLEERLKTMASEMEDLKIGNSHLKESFVVSNIELQLVESVNDQLNSQVRIGKQLLSQKEKEILKAAEMFSALRDEKTELQRMVEHLKIKYDEARRLLEHQASQILELSSEKDRQDQELGCLCEVNQKLEAEMRHLQQELRKTKLREQELSYELQKGTREIQQWETHAASLFSGLQISAVNEALLEGKVHELAEACQNLERRSNFKGMESERLKERVNELEGENGRLQRQLAAYVPAVSALNDCITSLEMHTLLPAKSIDYKQSKVQNLVNQKCTSGRQTGVYQDTTAPSLPDFQDMQKRINAIEGAVKQMNESFNPKTEMREIQELKPGISRRQVNIQPNWHAVQMDEAKERRGGSFREHKTGKSVPDIPITEIECLPKDIMLDQMAECSSFGVSRRGTLESDEQLLELWETANRDGTIGLKVSNSQRMAAAPAGYRRQGSIKELKNRYPSAHFFTEKELSVDKVEVPRSSTQSREEGNRRKVLEKLDSDAQKLTNLEITVQDLIKRIEISEKSTRGKDVEYDNVKEQLEAAQESITKLFDANHKLVKSVQGGALSSAGRSSTDSDESGGVRRMRISARARRGSEKIGRLQLEVQRLQFLLLKLNEEKQARGKTVVDDPNSRVLLRDYLYGQTRIKYQLRKKKKAHFCACIQPPTKGD
ncbi:hypothetical protein S83_053454 [Arachis hypogaea]